MSELILVRHGQANSLAQDEESYDRLSDLGREQARWLGAHMGQTNPHFDRVITGTLSRQVDTAKEMGYEITQQDERLNEISYFNMANAMEAQYGIPVPGAQAEYAQHLPKLMRVWIAGELDGADESYADFTERVGSFIDEQCAGHGRALLVTSGGVIGMVIAQTLQLGPEAMSKVMLQIMNTSFHRLVYVHDTLMMGGFNATPHLDAPDRAHARTHV